MTEARLSAGQKTLIDLGPLGVFFAANYFYGIMIGTAALMAATLAVILITFWIERSIPPMPAITCLLYTSPSPRDGLLSRMPSSA